ncbi:Riboflavin transport system permease protein RibX [bacterium HR39]|nr:Riboflavin transport system permease protein RibX [bacterium HR39]
MRTVLRPLLTAAGLLALWELAVRASGVPPYILPPPSRVLATLWQAGPLLAEHGLITLIEILLGMAIGAVLGAAAALSLALLPPLRRWLEPVLVASQAIPVFALAPLLVLWLGYGIGSKVAMAVLIIFFPVATAFFDGLRRTDPGWLELARVMDAKPLRVLFEIRVPAALPALGSGLRVAAAVAPIGAVIGEWVGASRGLGYLMLHANARLRVDLVFAALSVLALLALALFRLTDRLVARLVYWQRETLPGSVHDPEGRSLA